MKALKTQMVRVKELQLSELNIRNGKPDPKDPGIKELADSILVQGILNPLQVRKTEKGMEVLAGGRRLAAAKLLNLVEVPVVLVETDDAGAQEISLVENNQRENLDALQEAKGLRRLIDGGKTVHDAAEALGKSEAYVYRRLRLLELSPAGQQAFQDGRLGLADAAQLAAVKDPKVQARLLELAVPKHRWEDPLPVAQAIKQETHGLARAKWDLTADGIGGKISCSACPERTKNQALLFDTGKGDSCLNGKCWAAKAAACAADGIRRLEEAGTAKAASPQQISEHAVDRTASEGRLGRGLLDLDAEYRNPNTYQTAGVWRKLLPKDHGLKVLAFPGSSGEVILGVDSSKAHALLPKKLRRQAPRSSGQKAETPEAKAKRELKERLAGRALELAVAAIPGLVKKPLALKLLKVLAADRIRFGDRADEVARLRDGDPRKNGEARLEAELAKLKTAEEVLGLSLQLLALFDSYGTEPSDDLLAILKVCGVSMSSFEKAAEAEAEKAAAKVKAGKGGR